ncbi:TMV resistance protein N-like [Solanum stenotomum]|uniref:TMV resistance protein N-like n=1 Tax=Solanum stenotomum TaxID=172797 RepID=UPI0020D17A69|nr:TMV resistance protein N-like [Solanum stenotomum]
MSRELALSNHSEYPDESDIHFFLVPLGGLWDASNANGKTPNDYGIISLGFGEKKKFGVRSSSMGEAEVLIVLDDIDERDHLEYLAGGVGWFGNGSRVIVTTRNRQLIEKDAAIYEVPTLPDDDAMQLFKQHAFKKEVPDQCFKKFSLETK